eukprot:Gb_20836 [translate_table: standard]
MEKWKEIADIEEKCQIALGSMGQGHEAAFLIQQNQVAKAQKIREQLEQKFHIESDRWRAALHEEKLRRKQYQERERIAKKRLKARKNTACWERNLARLAARSVGEGWKELEKTQLGHRERIVLPEPSDYRHTFLHSSLLLCKGDKGSQAYPRELNAWEAADLQREIMEHCRLVQKEIKNVTDKRQALRGQAALSRNSINQRIHQLEEELLSVSQGQHENQRQLTITGKSNLEHEGVHGEVVHHQPAVVYGHKNTTHLPLLSDICLKTITLNDQQTPTHDQHTPKSPLGNRNAEDKASMEVEFTHKIQGMHEAVNTRDLEIKAQCDYQKSNDALQKYIDLDQAEAEKNGRDYRWVKDHTINKSCWNVPDATNIQEKKLTVSKARKNDSQQTPSVVHTSSEITKPTKLQDASVKISREATNSNDANVGEFTSTSRMPKRDSQSKGSEPHVVRVEHDMHHKQMFSNAQFYISEHRQKQKQGKLFKHQRKAENGGILGEKYFGTSGCSLPKEDLVGKPVRQQSGSNLEQPKFKSKSFHNLEKGPHVSGAESVKFVVKTHDGLELTELLRNQLEGHNEELQNSDMVHNPAINTKRSVAVRKSAGNVKFKKKLRLKVRDDALRISSKEKKNTCSNGGILFSANRVQTTLSSPILTSKSDTILDRKMSAILDSGFLEKENRAVNTLPSFGQTNERSDKMQLGAVDISSQSVLSSRCQSRLRNLVCEKVKKCKSKCGTAKGFGKSDILSNIQPQKCCKKLGSDVRTPSNRGAATVKSKSRLSLKCNSRKACDQNEIISCFDSEKCVTGLGNITTLKDISENGSGSTNPLNTNADQSSTLPLSKHLEERNPSIFLEESTLCHSNNCSRTGDDPVVTAGHTNYQMSENCKLLPIPTEKGKILGSDGMLSQENDRSFFDPESRSPEGITSTESYEEENFCQNEQKDQSEQRSKMVTARIVAKKLIESLEAGSECKRTIKSNLQRTSSNSIDVLKADFKLRLNKILESRNIKHADQNILNRIDQMLEPLEKSNILLPKKSLQRTRSQEPKAPSMMNDFEDLEEQLVVVFKQQLTEILETIDRDNTDKNILTTVSQLFGSSDRTNFDASQMSLPNPESKDLEALTTERDENKRTGENLPAPLCAGVNKLDLNGCKMMSTDQSSRSFINNENSEGRSMSTERSNIHEPDNKMSDSGFKHNNTTVSQRCKLHSDKTMPEMNYKSNHAMPEKHENLKEAFSLEIPSRQESIERKDCLDHEKQGPNSSVLSVASEQLGIGEHLSQTSALMQSIKDLSRTSEKLLENEDLKQCRDSTLRNGLIGDITMLGGQSAEYRLDNEDAYTCLTWSSISSIENGFVSSQNEKKGNEIVETHGRSEDVVLKSSRLQPKMLFAVDQLKEENYNGRDSASLRSSASLSSTNLHELMNHKSSFDLLTAIKNKRHTKKEFAQRLVPSYAESTDSLDSCTGNSSFEDWPCSVIAAQTIDLADKSSNYAKPSVFDGDILSLQVHERPDSSGRSGSDGGSQPFRRCSRTLNVNIMGCFSKTSQSPIQDVNETDRKSEICESFTETTSKWRSGLLVGSNELINLEEEDGYLVELTPWSMDEFIGMSPRKQDEYHKEKTDCMCASQEKKETPQGSVLNTINGCSGGQNKGSLNLSHSSIRKVQSQRQRNGSKKPCKKPVSSSTEISP